VPDLIKTPPRTEGVYFGFPFAVADPVVRMETPWAVVRLETDQLPGACRDWYTVQRWIDVANQDYGLTLATPDALMAEFGKIADQRMATKHINPSGVVYSYIMNNYWETNYQHSQGGKILFRYAVLPHYRFESAAAARFGVEQSQPMISVPVAADAPVRDSFLRIEPAGIILTSIKPARDGAGFIVRLYNASAGPQTAALTLPDKNSRIYLSNPAEETLAPVPAPTLNMLPYESITLHVKP
jgi:alpha-mannosidase